VYSQLPLCVCVSSAAQLTHCIDVLCIYTLTILIIIGTRRARNNPQPLTLPIAHLSPRPRSILASPPPPPPPPPPPAPHGVPIISPPLGYQQSRTTRLPPHLPPLLLLPPSLRCAAISGKARARERSSARFLEWECRRLI